MDNLETLREKIDQIDNKILALFAKRFSLVGRIGTYKRAQKIPVINKGREKKKIESLAKKGRTQGVSRNFIENVWQAIFVESYKFER